MKIGALVRRSLGPLERPVSYLYRRMLIDLDDLVTRLHPYIKPYCNILEVGCGEGAVAERLNHFYPSCSITGLDFIDHVGRSYNGDRSKVSFKKAYTSDLSSNYDGGFHVVVICDVFHHVPLEQQKSILNDVVRLLAPGGTLVFKDWYKTNSLVHFFCWFLDRYITGDKIVHRTEKGYIDLMHSVFGPGSIVLEASVRPWKNNQLLIVAKP